MTAPVLLAGSALAVVLTVALIHQVRVRRGLERLLARLIDKWRDLYEKTDAGRRGRADSIRVGGRVQPEPRSARRDPARFHLGIESRDCPS